MDENPYKSPEVTSHRGRRGYGASAVGHLFGIAAALAWATGSAWSYDALQNPGTCEGWCFVSRLLFAAIGFWGCVRYGRWYRQQ